MWKLLLFLILSVQLGNAQDSIVRDYFFDQNLTVDSTTSLVLLVKRPQTEFAKNLGHRIYTDSNQFNELKRMFYKNIVNGEIEQQFCGADLYFSLWQGDKEVYYNAMNSDCSLHDFECENLDILKEFGAPLNSLQLTEIPVDFVENKEHYFTNLVSYFYESKMEWQMTKTSLYPAIYYEHYFKVTLDLDTTLSPQTNIENYISQYTTNFEGVNWNLWYDNYFPWDGKFDPRKMKDGRCSVELYVYFKESRLDDFVTVDHFPNLPLIEAYDPLTLIYKAFEHLKPEE